MAMVEREVLQCLASHLVRRYQDELPGLVNVARVKMPVDLRSATVFVSVIAPGSDEGALRKEAAEFLQDRAGEIQAHLNSELKLRYVPKLTFKPDDVLEKVLRVEGILHDLAKKRDSEE